MIPFTLHNSNNTVDLENGVFPNYYDRTDEQLKEVARLFHVGVTRENTQIHLTYASDESPLSPQSGGGVVERKNAA